jgi:hypothetical protein
VAEADRAPGAHRSGRERLRNYIVGLGLASILTAASFAAASSNLVWAQSVPVLLAVVAIAQMGVHLVFFLPCELRPRFNEHYSGLGLRNICSRTGSIRLDDHYGQSEPRHGADGQTVADATLGAQGSITL